MKTPLVTFLVFVGLVVMPVAAELRINEFLASNATGRTADDGETYDWIEIHNAGAVAISLEGYLLTDDDEFSAADSETYWQFPAMTLGPESYLIVYASGRSDASVEGDGSLHASFKLSSAGEYLALIAPDGETPVTEFAPAFPPQYADISYGYGDGGGFVFFSSPTPGAANGRALEGIAEPVAFTVTRGFFEEPFSVELSTATEGATILYTTDGREPSQGSIFTGPTGTEYSGSILIEKTTVVRAVAFKDGWQSSPNRAQTYLFLDDVIRQPKQPEGFPERWGSRPVDYEMDPDVVGNIYSEEQVKDALRSLPTISLVIDNDHLFDARTGIYTNSQAKGEQWERPVSVEFFDFPHGLTTQANAGLRLQGNASRNPNRVKHNMRIAFRREYGPSKLDFRLFENSEVERFNSINLRSNNGDSWIHPGVAPRAQYIRDQWHRDVQAVMNQPHQPQIYAHLYINGLYWGLYHVFERFEASLLAEHFGGEEDDWDALQDTPQFQDIVVNGDDEAWQLTHELAKEDMSVEANYEEMLRYIDVDNLVDYLLINFYSSNQDWDHKNMRYGRRRVPAEGLPGSGWLFFAWDSERHGLNGLSDTSVGSNVTNKNTTLGPTFLNRRLHAHPDYKLRFGDRVAKHCFDGGALTPEGAARVWNGLAEQIYDALIAESARWGDLHSANDPRVREGSWQTQLDRENEVFMAQRTDILLDQLAGQGFFPSKAVFPVFVPPGGVVEAGSAVSIGARNASIFNPVKGPIYLTTDGSDPRMPGGGVSPEAIAYDPDNPPVIAHSQRLMARVHEGDGQWSPLAENVFLLGEAPTAATLEISEVSFAPAAPGAAEETAGYERASDFEFIELANRGSTTLDLSGLVFTNGVSVRIDGAQTSLLKPGDYVVVVANRGAFAMRYPEVDTARIVGEFENESRLDNEGERLTLRDYHGWLLYSVRYRTRSPWPEASETEGGTLNFSGVEGGSIGNPSQWRLSRQAGGTPGAAPETDPGGELNLTKWLTSHGFTSALEVVDALGSPALLYYAAGEDTVPAKDFTFLPNVLPVSNESGEFVQLTYHLRSGIDDIEITVERSGDLLRWEAETAAPAEVTGSGDGYEILTADIPRTESVRYWRLRVRVRP